MDTQQIFNMNLEFAITRELISFNGLGKECNCEKHHNFWYKQIKHYSTINQIYILQLPKFTGVM